MSTQNKHDQVSPRRAQLVRTRRELLAQRQQVGGRVALVMTMGALHEGHLELIRTAHRHGDHVIVTIFVNPTQFAPGEDYDAYPRTLEADVEAVNRVGADLIFAPSESEVYPHGPARVSINPGPTATILEGATRPTHFAGVCLVVNKVFNLTRPDVAIFGRKDAQQLAIIKQMVRDLDMGIEIVGVDTVREADGLALSSRNRYLNAEQRSQALALSHALAAGRDAAASGAAPEQILAAAHAVIDTAAGVEVDYVALVEPVDFTPLPQGYCGPAVLATAARVGPTRLIDNLTVEVK